MHCLGESDIVSSEVQEQQQQMLLYFQRQQTARMFSSTVSNLHSLPDTKNVSSSQQHLPLVQPVKQCVQSAREFEQPKVLESKAAAKADEAGTDQAVSLRLSLSQEYSADSASSAEASLSTQQLPGATALPALNTLFESH